MSATTFANKIEEKNVCIPKKDSIEQLPLEFQSNIPVPPIPANISIGNLASYDFTLVNNSPDTIGITASITGSPIGDATVDSGSQCLSGTWAPAATCTLTVDIDPTVTGAATYVLSANYTVSGDPSCFNDVTVDIDYNAIDAFVYVSNSQGDSVTVCKNTGPSGFTDCGDAGATSTFDGPGGIRVPVETFSGDKYAYVTSFGTNTVSQCLIDLTDGTFADPCVDSGAGTIFSLPADIAFNAASSTLYAYITNSGGFDVIKCVTDLSDGTLGTCGTASAPFDSPFGIAHQTVTGLSVEAAYITNQDAGTVTQCAITGESGQLVHCFDSGPGDIFTTPTNITFFETADIYAYITDFDYLSAGAVWQCLFSPSNGLLSACATTGSGFDHPLGISFETVNSVDYAYVTNALTNTVETCDVDSGSGNLTSCASSSLLSTDILIDITQQSFSGSDYLYVADAVQESILQCKIDSTTIETANIYCIDSGTAGVFSNPPSSVTFQVVNGTTYGYVNEPESGIVWQCTVNTSTGQFTGCVDSGPIGFEAPYVTTLGTVNSVLYAYVSDVDFDTVWQCEVDAVTGALCDCTNAAQNIGDPLDSPIGVSFQTFAGTSYVYVGELVNGDIQKCTLNATTGLFTACVDSGASALNQPAAFEFKTINSNLYIYIPNLDPTVMTPFLTKCLVNTTTGQFSACSDNDFDSGQAGIAFQAVDGTNYAYVTVGDSTTFGEILRCVVGSDGSLSTCVSPFGEPNSIALQLLTGGSTVAYVAQAGGSGILECQVNNSNGSITSCADAGTRFSFSSPVEIMLETIGSTTFAYISDSVLNTVTQCIPNLTTGALASCVDSGAGAIFTQPAGVTFDLVDSGFFAYVVDEAGDTVTQCIADEITGLFSACETTGTFFVDPLGITFNDNKVYIAESTQAEVTTCDQRSDGFLINCINSGPDPSVFARPTGVGVFNDADGDEHLYVSNSLNVGGPPDSTVAYCLVDPTTGLLSACADSGLGQIFASPAGLAFQAFDGTFFLYITNSDTVETPNNSVSRCTLNADGTLNACVDSGAGMIFNNPVGIAFLNP